MRVMIEEFAIVVAHEPGIAWVETSHRNACGTCDQSAGCGNALLGGLFTLGANRLALEDRLGIAIGERVVIGIPDTLLVRAAVIAYLIPLLTLVAGAGLAQWLQLAETGVALTGIVGLGAGIWLTGQLTGGAKGRQRYQPLLLRREPATASIHCESITAPRARHSRDTPKRR